MLLLLYWSNEILNNLNQGWQPSRAGRNGQHSYPLPEVMFKM